MENTTPGADTQAKDSPTLQNIEIRWTSGLEKRGDNVLSYHNPNGQYTIIADIRDNEEHKQVITLLKASPKMLKALEKAIQGEIRRYECDKQSADYFNNNTDGVGQTIDYQTYDPLPKWVEECQEVIKEAKGE